MSATNQASQRAKQYEESGSDDKFVKLLKKWEQESRDKLYADNKHKLDFVN